MALGEVELWKRTGETGKDREGQGRTRKGCRNPGGLERRRHLEHTRQICVEPPLTDDHSPVWSPPVPARLCPCS